MDDTGHRFVLFLRTTQVVKVLRMLFSTRTVKDPELWTEVFGLYFAGGGERGWIQDKMR